MPPEAVAMNGLFFVEEDNVKKIVLFPFCAVLLAGCATPKVTLKNESTGQVATCGGGRVGSLSAGVVGYHAEKGKDAGCVMYYEANGYKRTE